MTIKQIYNVIPQKEAFPGFLFIVGDLGINEPNKNVYRKPSTKTDILDINCNIVLIEFAKFSRAPLLLKQTRANKS